MRVMLCFLFCEPFFHVPGVASCGIAADRGVPFFQLFRAQGAAQAVEDGAVLGVLLGGLRQKEYIRERLMGYEELRRPRANKVRDLSVENLQIFHMLGGEDGGMEIPSFGKGHDNWAEVGFCDWLFGYDVVKEAEAWRDGMQRGLRS